MFKRLTALLLLLCLTAGAALCIAEAADPGETARKVVYLTFDDGPKADTPELVALLEELDVKATFFFVGLAARAFPENAKLVYDAGHKIGCHSHSHSPTLIKEDNGFVGRDIDRFMAEIRSCVGEEFTTDIYRFPGGSTSYRKRIKRAVQEKGLTCFDWNSLSGDTHPGVTAQDIYESAIKTGADEDVIIVLMHEQKARTRQILPDLVAYYRERGYEFRTLSADPEEREILARCPAKIIYPEDEEL
ncbi:MAG: polysaccharide deacetylase family protein [Clostridia bacterium]|nr:polysaccharide deacetylase family protein [Clostridia bacterium]